MRPAGAACSDQEAARPTRADRANRPSNSRPGQGIVEFEHKATNQRGEVVATCRRSALMKGKPAA
jgi:acyl dehydratase